MKPLVSTEWLDKNLKNVRILDASWHLPAAKRDAFKEFKESHIKDSTFFDIDRNSNQNSSLPHMLTKKDEWEKILSKFGIDNSDHMNGLLDGSFIRSVHFFEPNHTAECVLCSCTDLCMYVYYHQ